MIRNSEDQGFLWNGWQQEGDPNYSTEGRTEQALETQTREETGKTKQSRMGTSCQLTGYGGEGGRTEEGKLRRWHQQCAVWSA